jgi:hypothetical protein
MSTSRRAVTPPEFVEVDDDIAAVRQLLRNSMRIPRWQPGLVALVWLVPVLYPLSSRALFSGARLAQEHFVGAPLALLALLWACAGPFVAVYARSGPRRDDRRRDGWSGVVRHSPDSLTGALTIGDAPDIPRTRGGVAAGGSRGAGSRDARPEHARRHCQTSVDGALEGYEVVLSRSAMRYFPGASTPAHSHPGVVLAYVLEGHVRFGINNEPERVGERR